MKNIVLFGAPGSGKGTQAQLLVEKFGFLHISTGDLFRYEIANGTPLGIEAKGYMERGELVPNSVTIGMLKNKMLAHPEAKGILFDGFPRNIAQSEALDAMLAENETGISALVELSVGEEEIVARIIKRGETSGRADDTNEAIIRKRIQIYRSETTPVFDYYNATGKAHKIQGVGSVEDIFQQLSKLVQHI